MVMLEASEQYTNLERLLKEKVIPKINEKIKSDVMLVKQLLDACYGFKEYDYSTKQTRIGKLEISPCYSIILNQKTMCRIYPDANIVEFTGKISPGIVKLVNASLPHYSMKKVSIEDVSEAEISKALREPNK